MQDGLRLSGTEMDIDPDVYRDIFTRFVSDGGEVECRFKSLKDMSPTELVDHMESFRQASMILKVARSAAKMTLDAKKIHLTEQEREELRIRDLSYKPKPKEDPDKPKRARRASGTAKTLDAVEMMMDTLGISREKAEAKLRRIQEQLGEPVDAPAEVIPPEEVAKIKPEAEVKAPEPGKNPNEGLIKMMMKMKGLTYEAAEAKVLASLAKSNGK